MGLSKYFLQGFKMMLTHGNTETIPNYYEAIPNTSQKGKRSPISDFDSDLSQISPIFAW